MSKKGFSNIKGYRDCPFCKGTSKKRKDVYCRECDNGKISNLKLQELGLLEIIKSSKLHN